MERYQRDDTDNHVWDLGMEDGRQRLILLNKIICRDVQTWTADLTVPNRAFYQLNYIPIGGIVPWGAKMEQYAAKA